MSFLAPSAPKAQKLVTQQEYDKALADFDAQGDSAYQQVGVGPDRKAARQSLMDSMLVPPPPPPDLSDDLVQKARLAQRKKLLSGGGLVGPLDLAPGTTAVPGLSGV